MVKVEIKNKQSYRTSYGRIQLHLNPPTTLLTVYFKKKEAVT